MIRFTSNSSTNMHKFEERTECNSQPPPPYTKSGKTKGDIWKMSDDERRRTDAEDGCGREVSERGTRDFDSYREKKQYVRRLDRATRCGRSRPRRRPGFNYSDVLSQDDISRSLQPSSDATTTTTSPFSPFFFIPANRNIIRRPLRVTHSRWQPLRKGVTSK